jgi:hypothetical protein
MRVQREIGKESFVGVLATNRDFASGFDRVLAVDGRFKLSPNWVFTGQLIESQNQALDGNRQRGSAASAAISRSGRHFTYKSGFLERSPDFSAPLGFIPRVDIREMDHYTSYYWRPNGGPLISFGPALSTSMDWNYTGRRQDWSAQPEFDFYFRRQYGVSLYHSESYELFKGVDLREYSNTISLYSSRSKQLSLSGSFGSGVSPNYSPPQGMQPFLGRAANASFGLTFRPTRRLRVDETYYYSSLSTRAGAAPAGSTATNIFTNHITRTKVNFQFTRELSVRGILDYNRLVPTQSLILYDLSEHLTGDVLFTYLVNPFTALYVGYTEGHQNLEIDASGQPTLRVTTSASPLASRQVFLKISYRLGL